MGISASVGCVFHFFTLFLPPSPFDGDGGLTSRAMGRGDDQQTDIDREMGTRLHTGKVATLTC